MLRHHFVALLCSHLEFRDMFIEVVCSYMFVPIPMQEFFRVRIECLWKTTNSYVALPKKVSFFYLICVENVLIPSYSKIISEGLSYSSTWDYTVCIVVVVDESSLHAGHLPHSPCCICHCPRVSAASSCLTIISHYIPVSAAFSCCCNIR